MSIIFMRNGPKSEKLLLVHAF